MVTVGESLDDVVVQIGVCPAVVTVVFTGIEVFVIVVISVTPLENSVIWIMVGFEDGDIVIGWSDEVVTLSCLVVTVGRVVSEVFILVIVGEVEASVGTVGCAVVVVVVFTVVGSVLVTEVALIVEWNVEAVFEELSVLVTLVVAVIVTKVWGNNLKAY